MAPKQEQKTTINKVYVTFLKNSFAFIPDRKFSVNWGICINKKSKIL